MCYGKIVRDSHSRVE